MLLLIELGQQLVQQLHLAARHHWGSEVREKIEREKKEKGKREREKEREREKDEGVSDVTE